MSRGLGLLVGVMVLLGPALTGCLDALEGDDAVEPAQLARQIEVVVDDTDAGGGPDDPFEATTVGYVYTHRQEPIDPAEITVHYTDQGEQDAEEPLSRFTDRSTLQQGDRVEISPVHPLSDIQLTREAEEFGAKTIAERHHEDRDWLRAEGGPLPIAVTEGGSAKLELSTEATLEGDASGLNFQKVDPDDSGAPRIETAQGELSVERETTFSIAATGPDTIELDTKVDADTLADVDSKLHTEREGEFEAGVDATSQATVEALYDLALSGRDVQRVDGQVSAYMDGDVTVWNPDHPREEQWTPPEFRDHPWLDESEETSEIVRSTGTSPEERDNLQRLWGLDLRPGDKVSFDLTTREDGTEAHIEAAAQVVDRGPPPSAIGASTGDAYEVSGQVHVTSTADDGEVLWEQRIQSTAWIDTASHLPVHEQVRTDIRVDSDQVASLLRESAQEETGEQAEELERAADEFDDSDFFVAFNTESLLQLADHQEGITVAPIAGVTASLSPFSAGPLEGWFGELTGGEIAQPGPYQPADEATRPCETLEGRHVHEHAELLVHLPGREEPFDFSSDRYQVQEGFVHFEQGHNPPDRTVHIHEVRPTLQCLFATIEWTASQEEIVTDTGEWYPSEDYDIEVLVDGQPATAGFQTELFDESTYEVHVTPQS